MYPKRVKYESQKSLNNLLIWAMKFAKGKVTQLNKKDYFTRELQKQSESTHKMPWLITFCLSSNNNEDDIDDEKELNYELNCLENITNLKLAIALDGLVNVGSIDCTKESAHEICSKLKPPRDSPILYYSQLPELDSKNTEDLKIMPIQTSDYKEISRIILEDLPSERELTEGEFNSVLSNLKDEKKFEKTWLIKFVSSDYKPGSDLQLKKLGVLLGKGNYILKFIKILGKKFIFLSLTKEL